MSPSTRSPASAYSRSATAPRRCPAAAARWRRCLPGPGGSPGNRPAARCARRRAPRRRLVTTVFDPLLAQCRVYRGLRGDWPPSYDDAPQPRTPAWAVEITLAPTRLIARIGREFARHAAGRPGRILANGQRCGVMRGAPSRTPVPRAAHRRCRNPRSRSAAGRGQPVAGRRITRDPARLAAGRRLGSASARSGTRAAQRRCQLRRRRSSSIRSRCAVEEETARPAGAASWCQSAASARARTAVGPDPPSRAAATRPGSAGRGGERQVRPGRQPVARVHVADQEESWPPGTLVTSRLIRPSRRISVRWCDRVGASHQLGVRVAGQYVVTWLALVARRLPGRAQHQFGDQRVRCDLAAGVSSRVPADHPASSRSPRAASASSSRWKYTSPPYGHHRRDSRATASYPASAGSPNRRRRLFRAPTSSPGST